MTSGRRRRSSVPDTGAADLRGARRPDPAGLRAEQPRHRRLRGGRVGRGDRLYERSREALGARRRVGRGRGHRPQHRRDPARDQGHLDEAERLVRESLRTHRAAEYPMGIAYSTQYLGRITARAGRPGGRELLADALDLWRHDRQRGPRDRDRGEAGRGDAVRWRPRGRARAVRARRSSGSGTSPSYRGCGRCSSGSSAARWGRRVIAMPAWTPSARRSASAAPATRSSSWRWASRRSRASTPPAPKRRRPAQEANDLLARLGVIGIAAIPLPALADVSRRDLVIVIDCSAWSPASCRDM